VPAEQHLPRRPAVDEDQRWLPCAIAVVEQLPLNGPAVGGLEGRRARRDQLALGEVGGHRPRAEVVAARSVLRDGGD
jgi:hypothetical protein